MNLENFGSVSYCTMNTAFKDKSWCLPLALGVVKLLLRSKGGSGSGGTALSCLPSLLILMGCTSPASGSKVNRFSFMGFDNAEVGGSLDGEGAFSFKLSDFCTDAGGDRLAGGGGGGFLGMGITLERTETGVVGLTLEA